MLYAVLCYNSEVEICSWTKEQDDAVMERLAAVNERMARRGKLGPVARLHSTATARTLRKDRHPFVITDGPFAEAKEVIGGFMIINAEDLAAAKVVAEEYITCFVGVEEMSVEVRQVVEPEEIPQLLA